MSSPEPKTNPSDTVSKHKEFLFPAVATYYQEPLALVKGEGAHVWDEKGDKYLDCFGGVLTVSVGHANPKVNEAIVNQFSSMVFRLVSRFFRSREDVEDIAQDVFLKLFSRIGQIRPDENFPPPRRPRRPA